MTTLLPTNCEILIAEITRYDLNITASIKDIITEVTIFQSLDATSIRGSLTVFDAIGFLDDFPLRAEEKLKLHIQGHDSSIIRKLDLFIFKIDNIILKDQGDGVQYTLHFISYLSYKASLRKVVKAYDNIISDTVLDVFNNYYKEIKRETRPSDLNQYPGGYIYAADDVLGAKFFQVEETKGLFIEPTYGLIRCIIPSYSPQEAMTFLASRSYSTYSPSCSFRFFETIDNFMFVSDEYLVKYAVKNNNVKEFTYRQFLDTTPNSLDKKRFNLETIEILRRSDTADDLYSGGYNLNVMQIDFVAKEIQNKRYTYEAQKSLYTKMSGIDIKEAESVHSTFFTRDTFTEENEREFLLFKDYDTHSGQLRGEQYLPDIVGNRVIYGHSLNSTVLSVTTSGRIDMNAGEVVNLLITDFTFSSDRDVNSTLSGNYLVHTVAHSIIQNVLTTTMKLVKFNWTK